MTIEPTNVSEGLECAVEQLNHMRSLIGIMFGRGPDCILPETVGTPLGVPIQLGAMMRETDDVIAALATLSPPLPSPGVERIVETGSKYKTLDEFCEALFTEKDERRLDTLIGEVVTIMHELAALSALPLDGGLK